MSPLIQYTNRASFSPTIRTLDRRNSSTPTTTHSSSKVWLNPRIREKHDSVSSSNRHVLNHARSQICRKSPFWTEDFDVKTHREAWTAGEQRRQQAKKETLRTEETQLQRSQSPTLAVIPALRAPFNAQLFSNNRSYVLGLETVFCPTFERGSKEGGFLAPWPSRAEAKYEGDDRISTDRLHRRFPGAPRVEPEGEEGVVAWNCLRVIEQFPLDDFYFPIPQAVEVFLRTHYVDELEFGDEEGGEILGKELFRALDPVDQW